MSRNSDVLHVTSSTAGTIPDPSQTPQRRPPYPSLSHDYLRFSSDGGLSAMDYTQGAAALMTANTQQVPYFDSGNAYAAWSDGRSGTGNQFQPYGFFTEAMNSRLMQNAPFHSSFEELQPVTDLINNYTPPTNAYDSINNNLVVCSMPPPLLSDTFFPTAFN
ncbi:unnamed protein product [Dibothriocephalus latus]|uniref:Uncharacterized protein n=1 Tax=Dibothriocephalus latus TaxID=60516 RepID=A0A3P7REV8_DIBLA|nr:unnamed protein product [Dibothriocephalus latus]